MSVCILGMGRVGLPSVVLFGRAGHHVVAVDVDEGRRQAVASGDAGPEPGLSAALQNVLAVGRVDVQPRAVPADAYVVCVATPLNEQREAELHDVNGAFADIAEVAPSGALVSLSSTVPVGTTEAMTQRWLAGRGCRVAFCPERVLPTRALHEIAANDRLVGGVDDASTEAVGALWDGVTDGAVWRTDARTAELVKLIENASRDAEIAVANTAAMLAEAYDVDPYEVRALANRHPRVNLLMPGIGVGGHCMPVDPWFAIAGAPQAGRLFEVCRQINDGMAQRAVERVRASVPPGTPLALLGLAYKPETDDLRNSPALVIARALADDYDVVVHDPFVTVPSDLREVSREAALERPVVVVAVGHQVFRDLPLRSEQVCIDLCGVSR